MIPDPASYYEDRARYYRRLAHRYAWVALVASFLSGFFAGFALRAVIS